VFGVLASVSMSGMNRDVMKNGFPFDLEELKNRVLG